MATHFKPSDVRTIECIVNNLTRAGAAFGVTETDEQVFIPVKLADDYKIDVGDTMTCFCVDLHLDENLKEERPSARYRAIRIKKLVRLDEEAAPIPAAPVQYAAPEPVAPPPPPKPVLETQELKKRLMVEMQSLRAWTSRDMSEFLARRWEKDFTIPDDFSQKVSAMMWHAHDEGVIAACALYLKKDQERPSFVYYAKDTSVLCELLDGELEEVE